MKKMYLLNKKERKEYKVLKAKYSFDISIDCDNDEKNIDLAKVIAFLSSNNLRMNIYDNGLDSFDYQSIRDWGLSYREEARTKIIDVPGFGEFCSTMKSDTEYRDMDKNCKRSIDNLKHSDKFKAFASTIKNCEMMELSDTYKLMILVAKQLGITDTIDENYINTVFKKHKDANLPLEHPFGRILRALYMMIGEWFVIPISVDDNTVRSVDCNDYHALFCVNIDGSINVRPFAKIGGSLAD